MANARWLEGQRHDAWAYGRQHTDHLLREYQTLHHLDSPPAPALIARELITDVLGVRLYFEPLPLDRYAQVSVVDGEPQVTVNSEIDRMDGVRDAFGVENVAMLHEIMHLDRDLQALVQPASRQFEGFEEPPGIVCFRSAPHSGQAGEVSRREFLAEEAGRAGAVSFRHLREVESFQELVSLAGENSSRRRQGWPLLYRCAEAIGVNSTALKKQMALQGLIAVENGELIVQAGLSGEDADEGARWRGSHAPGR